MAGKRSVHLTSRAPYSKEASRLRICSRSSTRHSASPKPPKQKIANFAVSRDLSDGAPRCKVLNKVRSSRLTLKRSWFGLCAVSGIREWVARLSDLAPDVVTG